MAYVYAACTVHVTILSKDDKFQPASNLMELHALTLATCSYALLYVQRIARVIDCSSVGEHIQQLSYHSHNGTSTEKHKLSQIGSSFHQRPYLLISNQSTPFSQNSHISQDAKKDDGMSLQLVQGRRNAVLTKNYLECTRKFPTQSSKLNCLQHL